MIIDGKKEFLEKMCFTLRLKGLWAYDIKGLGAYLL